MSVCVTSNTREEQHRVRSHSLQTRSRGETFIHNSPTCTNEIAHSEEQHLAHVRISIHSPSVDCIMWKGRVDRDETDQNRKQGDAFLGISRSCLKTTRSPLSLESCGENVEVAHTVSPRPPSGAYAHASGGARLALARSSVIRAALRPCTHLLVLRATSSARPFLLLLTGLSPRCSQVG